MNTNMFASLANQVAEQEDQTKAVATERRVIPAGLTLARMIEYVELGLQPQKDYKGKKKADCEEVRIAFELCKPDNTYIDSAGMERRDVISCRITKKLSSKAKFFKLMKKMSRGRAEIKHMAQMLGEAFIVEIFHNDVEKDGKTTTYANLFDSESSCNICAPFQQDLITGETKAIPVPEPKEQLRMFLWSNPTKECWNSIFIDGTYTIKEASGAEREVSKNWMQETLRSSTAFSGSALEAMLMQMYAAEGGLPPIEDGHFPSEMTTDEVPF